MTPQAILADLLECGIEPSVTPDGTGIAVPAGRLNPAQRVAIVANKTALIDYLIESSRITARLLAAAMRRCDQLKDSDKARQDMREQVLEVPPHQRQDWLDYFNQQNTQRAKP